MKPRTATAAISPELAQQCAKCARHAKTVGIFCLLALIALGLAWELSLAPLRPGGSWLALKVLPLLAAVRGFLRGRRYTFQWMSLAVWIYFTEGIVRATSDKGLSTTLGWIETGLSLALFVACAVYARMTETARQVTTNPGTAD
ncbi:MAG: hypothetical protein JWL63_3130 [Rhodocyclales bacterium]|nr:hypothetical protein [Rhodocyclales bacterium]